MSYTFGSYCFSQVRINLKRDNLINNIDKKYSGFIQTNFILIVKIKIFRMNVYICVRERV